MRISDTTLFAYRALADRRLRSILTILMVAIGIALITSLNGLSGGINGFINQQFNTLAPNVLTVTPGSIFSNFQGGGQSGFGNANDAPRVPLTALVSQNLAQIPGVDQVVPSFTGSVRVIAGGKALNTRMIGIDTYKLKLIIPSIELEDGTLVDQTDITGIGLGINVARPPGEDRPFAEVGSLIRIERDRFDEIRQQSVTDSKSFIVRGILKETGNPQYDNAVTVPLSVADIFLKKSSKYDSISVVTKDTNINDSVEASIRTIYGDKIGVASPRAILQTISTIIGGFTIFLSAIAGVSILVGAVGIVTTLYTAVLERTREIGTLKALGATGRNILLLFTAESLIIGILGSLFGMILGIVLSFALIPLLSGLGPGGGSGSFPSIVPTYTSENVLLILTLGVTISTIAGLYPAWRASEMIPIEALRKE